MRWGQEHQARSASAARRGSTGRSRAFAVTFASIVGHLVVGLALFTAWAKPEPPAYDPQPMTVALVTLPPPIADPSPPTPAKSAPAAAHARQSAVHETPKPAPTASMVAAVDKGVSADPVPGLSDAALSGASTAESGGGDGGCNMARRLQEDLGRDRLVQNAVAGFGGKAIMVWNGDWVWIDGEDGKGLTAVRQAMMWDIAFSPKACRAQPMHGLVVIAANGTRLVVGSGQWRWSDLLVPHPGAGSP